MANDTATLADTKVGAGTRDLACEGDLFSCEDLRSELRTRTIRGGAIVFGAMFVNKAVSLAILAVLARLLTPRDYGLFGMIMGLTAFLVIFSDMGLTLATVQKASLTRGQLSNMFWLNLALGLVLGAITAAVAVPVGMFYRESSLAPVVALFGLNFPLVALGAQHGALLQRRMLFGRLAIAETIGLVLGGVAGIAAALKGFGVYALVWQQLTMSVARTVSHWVLSGWLPGLPRTGAGIRGMLRFGGYLTAFNIVNYFCRNLDKVLLGRFVGAVSVGLYTRAYALILYPVSLVSGPMSRVCTPALSRLQEDPERMKGACLEILQLIAFISFPLMGILIVAGDDVVGLIYGAKWAEAVPLFRILCIAGIWQAIYNATGQVFVSSGRTDRQFRAGLGMSCVLVIAFVAGLPGGAWGVALAYSIAFSLAVFPYLAYTYATIGLSLVEVLRKLGLTLAAAGMTTASLLALRVYVLAEAQSIVRATCLPIVGSVLYLVVTYAMNPAVTRVLSRCVAWPNSTISTRVVIR